jgi:hypothetical protein
MNNLTVIYVSDLFLPIIPTSAIINIVIHRPNYLIENFDVLRQADGQSHLIGVPQLANAAKNYLYSNTSQKPGQS